MSTQGCRKAIIILLLVFGALVFILIQEFIAESEKGFIDDKLYVSGKVIKIHKSRNHSFGIVQFEIDSINGLGSQSLEYHKGLPFQLNAKLGEVYGTIGIEDTLANRIVLSGPEKRFYMYHNSEFISEGYIGWIHSSRDLEFIRENSLFSQ